ncbi:MAG: flippase-like domain-containing protein [Roseiflexaceae bacterium]|nr:flippase-like domain-containing protein [Roseiflexaceae bacterium]
MITKPPLPAASHHYRWRDSALSLLFLALAIGVMLHFVRPDELAHMLTSANPWWLAAALLCKLLGPFATAIVYTQTLRLLGYRRKLLSFWLIAQVAMFVNAALPAGPLVMSALLLRHFRRRSIPAAVTSLAVALDTVTYQVIFFGVLVVAIIHLLAHGTLSGSLRNLAGLLVLGLLVVYLALRSYDHAKITRFLVRTQQWLARLLRQPWQATAVEHFVDELARGGTLVRAQPLAIARLLFYQALVIGLDLLTLVCAFHALGHAPPVMTIVLSATLAAFLTTLTPLPGGGGTFEATVILSSIQAGVPKSVAVGATLIYRVLTFWLPLVLTAVTLRRLIGPDAPDPESPLPSAPEHTR